jgi:hypothetical protein
VVAWLVSDESAWLTGAVLRVDGDTVSRVRGWEIDPGTRHRSRHGGRLDATRLGAGLRRAYGVLPGTPVTTGG